MSNASRILDLFSLARLALMRAVRSNCIIGFDKDLLVVKRFEGKKIISQVVGSGK